MTYLQVVQIRKSLVLCYLHSLCALRDSLSLRRNLIAIRISSPQFISSSPLLTKRLDVRDIFPLCPALHSSLWKFSKNSPEQHSSVPKQKEYSNPQQHSLSRSLSLSVPLALPRPLSLSQFANINKVKRAYVPVAGGADEWNMSPVRSGSATPRWLTWRRSRE